jgi:MFS family permease
VAAGSARRRVAGSLAAIAQVARHRELRSAQLSFFGAWAAEWAFSVGLVVYAYQQGGQVAVGVVTLLRMVPAGIVAPFATPLADRWRREVVLVWVCLVRAAATAVAAVLVGADSGVAGVYAVAVVSTVAATLYRPAHSALMPSLCQTPDELTAANVVRGLLDSVATLAGPAAAGILLRQSGVSSVFVAAALASAAAALLMFDVRIRRQGVVERREVLEVVGRPRFREGLTAILSSGQLSLLVGLTGLQTVLRGAVVVLTVAMSYDLLHEGGAGVGVLNAGIGVGAVVGSLVATLLIGSGRLGRWFGVGVALWGLPIVVIAGLPAPAIALAMLAVIGIGNALVDAGLFTLMARLADDLVLARAFGVLESAGAFAVGIGSMVAPLLVDAIGLRWAMCALGLLPPVVVAACWSRLRQMDSGMQASNDYVDLLDSVPMFSPLPLPDVEHLARRLQPVTVAAGGTVFTQGDEGDRVYVIEAGTAEVVGDGESVAMLRAGEAFGEIALLRHVPRTATVRAVSDLQLLALSREHFLPVVTHSPVSVISAHSEVDRQLDRFAPRSESEDCADPV